MQKIKNENGITLAILVVTIIVMLILIGVSMDLGFGAADDAEDSNYLSELQAVGQATISEYVKALQAGYLQDETSIPVNFVGVRITCTGDDQLPNLRDNVWALTSIDAKGYKSYFRLDKDELYKLGIENTDDTYIINYYTGEVYNETKKITDGGSEPQKELYLKLNNAIQNTPDTDTTSFTD